MTNFRSLAGGYFSSTPFDKSIPTSIRCNNPGAINGASWEEKYPGFLETVETTPGNKTTIFETPEQGTAAWWDLMRRYNRAGATTPRQIVTKYGGGQDYSNYVDFVASKIALDVPVDLNSDPDLLKLGKAMFRYEAGRDLPWSDAQILYGLNIGRQYAGTATASPPVSKKTTGAVVVGGGIAAAIGAWIHAIGTGLIIATLVFLAYAVYDLWQRYRDTDATATWYHRFYDAAYKSFTIMWTQVCTVLSTVVLMLDPIAETLGGDDFKDALHAAIGNPKIVGGIILGLTIITWIARMRSVWQSMRAMGGGGAPT